MRLPLQCLSNCVSRNLENLISCSYTVRAYMLVMRRLLLLIKFANLQQKYEWIQLSFKIMQSYTSTKYKYSKQIMQVWPLNFLLQDTSTLTVSVTIKCTFCMVVSLVCTVFLSSLFTYGLYAQLFQMLLSFWS